MGKNALVVANSVGVISDFLRNDIEILTEKGYRIFIACNAKFKGNKTDEFIKEFNLCAYDVGFPLRELKADAVLESYKKISRILSVQKFDIIHCHTTIAAMITRLAAKKYRKQGAILIYTSHGFPFYEGAVGKRGKLYFAIEKYLSRYTDAIITICKEDYENAKKMNCKSVYQIPGVGADTDKIKEVECDVDKKRQELGIAGGERIILSIGEINANKNHKVVIEALGRLVKEENENLTKNEEMQSYYQHPTHLSFSYTYVICGRELIEQGKKKELEEVADELGVKVIFAGYRMDTAEISKCAYMGAIPSYKEGLGMAGIEILAAGVPLVGSNRQGIKDYVIDGETGVLCDPTSAESFVDGIKRLEELKENGIVTAEKCIKKAREFDIKRSREKMEEIYEQFSCHN